MTKWNTVLSGRKSALVTGGNRGIGRETVWQLAQLGVHVIVGARDLTKAKSVAADVQNQGGSAEGIALDVSVADSRRAAAAMIEANYGTLDILINNAGIWLESADASDPVANNTSTLSEGRCQVA